MYKPYFRYAGRSFFCCTGLHCSPTTTESATVNVPKGLFHPRGVKQCKNYLNTQVQELQTTQDSSISPRSRYSIRGRDHRHDGSVGNAPQARTRTGTRDFSRSINKFRLLPCHYPPPPHTITDSSKTGLINLSYLFTLIPRLVRLLSTTESPRLLPTTESPRLLSTTESPRLLSTTESPRLLPTTESPRLLSTTESPRLLSTTESPNV
ncbi:hypothetical protein J6590_079553 [Homalodisca vitripennis]|nr:hypothetical protein J6590_079553 [Homalodisca vitripennis]